MNRGGTQNANEQIFFSEQNQQSLFKALINEVASKSGPLDGREQNRLARTVDHYMNEVWDTNGPMPLQQLNGEVFGAALSDFNSYLRRSNIQMTVPPQHQPLRTMPSALTTSVPTLQRPQYENTVDQRLQMDTGSLFEQLQQDRNGNKGSVRPPVPDFRVPIEDESIPAVNLFEQIKKQREEEAARGATNVVNQTNLVGPLDPSPSQRLIQPAILNDANQNPTLALPSVPPAVQPLVKTSAQDVLIKQENIISHKEIENNLFVYSADRDWLNNTRDTRYNFTVNFQNGNNGNQGFAYGPTSQEKFKNIVRIELVKAIVPTEGLDTFVVNTGTPSNAPTYDTSTRLNVLGYPYIITRISELDGNNYGTNNAVDNSFGILQYDANWISDSTSSNVDSRGYLAMIPKFLKCQKVYAPTPLATLTKLTIQMNKPDGNPLTMLPDTVNINQIFASGLVPGMATTNSKYIGASMSNTSNSFYYIFYTGSDNYFSRFTISPGDRVQLGGITASLFPSSNASAANDLIGYFQQSGGLPVVAIGCSNASAPRWTDGPNAAGYANFFVVRALYEDPTTGSVNVKPFGGTSNANGGLALTLSNTTFDHVRAINLSHQTQLVFRVITRELDPSSRIRPDNL